VAKKQKAGVEDRARKATSSTGTLVVAFVLNALSLARYRREKEREREKERSRYPSHGNMHDILTPV
jgi:hypothetical protein